MLTLEALNSAKDLVSILADKNVTLSLAKDSPLRELMGLTRVSNAIECLSEIDTLPLALYDMNRPNTNDPELEVSEHTAFMDHMGDTLGKLLAGQVAFATSVVLPAIGELHNELKAAGDLETVCGIRSYKVEMVSGASLMDVSAIVDLVDGFSGVNPPRELPLQLDFKPLGDEELINLLKIGGKEYDDAIDVFVAQQGIVLIREVWATVFQGDRQNYGDYDQFRADRVKGLGRNFTTFLIASKLLMDSKAMPEVTGLSGMSSNKYSMYLKSLQEVTGSALYTNLSFKRQEEKRGKLIDKVDNKTVYVNKVVYDRYMSEGGDIETLLGAAISNDRKNYLDEINVNAEKYKQAWQYHVTIARQNAATSTVIDTRSCISNWVRRHLRNNEDTVVRNNVNRIIDNANAFVETISRKDVSDIDILAMRAVCLIVYNHTPALAIMSGVNEAMSTNAEVTKEDALNMSVLNYVSEWFADQIVIA